MNILLTNDDGHEAHGIRAAYDALRELGRVHVVAPRDEQSACSHKLTLRGRINVRRVEHSYFGTIHSVDGTPADCVRLGLAALLDAPIDLVVAGINQGANTGVDIYYSGTVAAAREAAICGTPAMAFSLALRKGVDPQWPAAAALTLTMVRDLLKESLPGPGFWSVNYPSPIPENARERIRRVPVASSPLPMQFHRTEGDDGHTMEFTYGGPYWSREVPHPSDYAAVRDGDIAVSAIPLFGRF